MHCTSIVQAAEAAPNPCASAARFRNIRRNVRSLPFTAMPLTLVMAYRYESLSTLAMELPTQDPLQLLPSSIQLSQLIRQRKQHQRMQLNASWIVREQLEGRCPDFRKRIQGYVRFLRGNLGILGNDSFLKEIAEDKVH